jgi:type I restriction enzyme M protein
MVKVSDIKDYDLSAKNPNKQQDIEHLPPAEILAKLKATDDEISDLISEIEQIMDNG